VIGVRHPDRRQLSGTMKAGQQGGVTAVCLDPIARLHRNERWRNHLTAMTQARELAMNAVTARSRLVAKRQQLALTSEPFAQLPDRTRVVVDLAEVFDGARPPALGNGDRDPFLVNIQANKSGMVHEARPHRSVQTTSKPQDTDSNERPML
jgi:hypothetical protein